MTRLVSRPLGRSLFQEGGQAFDGGFGRAGGGAGGGCRPAEIVLRCSPIVSFIIRLVNCNDSGAVWAHCSANWWAWPKWSPGLSVRGKCPSGKPLGFDQPGCKIRFAARPPPIRKTSSGATMPATRPSKRLRQPESGTGPSDVSGQNQPRTAGNRRTVHRRDDRLGKQQHRLQQLFVLDGVGMPLAPCVRLLDAVVDLLQVRTRTKGSARTAEDHRTDTPLLMQVRERLQQLVDHLPRERLRLSGRFKMIVPLGTCFLTRISGSIVVDFANAGMGFHDRSKRSLYGSEVGGFVARVRIFARRIRGWGRIGAFLRGSEFLRIRLRGSGIAESSKN